MTAPYQVKNHPKNIETEWNEVKSMENPRQV